MVEVHRNVVGVSGIVDEGEPLDDVALNGVGQIVDGIGAVGQAEVDDGRGLGVGCRIRPEQIGCVEIVVCPERRERGQVRKQLGVKGGEQVKGLAAWSQTAAFWARIGRADDSAGGPLRGFARRRW